MPYFQDVVLLVCTQNTTDNNWQSMLFEGHDKLILCLVAAHASIFIILRKPLFSWLNQRVKLFWVIRKYLPANIFGNVPFDTSSFINTNFNVRNS